MLWSTVVCLIHYMAPQKLKSSTFSEQQTQIYNFNAQNKTLFSSNSEKLSLKHPEISSRVMSKD